MTTLPILTTARLRLRPWRPDDDDDVAAFHAFQGDPRVIWWGHARDLAASRAALINRAHSDEPPLLGAWAIEQEGDVVGNALLVRTELGVEIGWHMRRNVQGRGIATEAATALLAHASRGGVDVVSAAIVPVNVPSVRVAEKLGFVVDGDLTRGGLFHERWRKRL